MKQSALLLACVLLTGFSLMAQTTNMPDKQVIQPNKDWMIRIAHLVIDTAFIEPYRIAVEKHSKAAIANEPGVLTLYALYEKDRPTQVTVVEIYASKEAYQHHIKTPHFLEYKQSTLHMVKSLQLVEQGPLAMVTKL